MIAHLPALRRYAVGLSGSLPAADDLVQDCIERALGRLDSLQSEEKMGGWLRSILFNLFIDGRRQMKSRGEDVQLGWIEDRPDGAASAERRHEAQEVLQATARLSPEHRQVLILVGVDGLSYRQAAEEIGVPIGTVMSRLGRARDQLRAILDQGVATAPIPLKPQ